MATQYGQLSVSIKDADGNTKSFVDYVRYDDATATLATILSTISAELGNLDDIIDGVISDASFMLKPTLPAGLKAEPVAGSNVQETGLINYSTDGPGGFTYSQDIPAFAQAAFSGKVIDLENAEVSTWTDFVTSDAGVLRCMDDRYAGKLVAPLKGKKSFRK